VQKDGEGQDTKKASEQRALTTVTWRAQVDRQVRTWKGSGKMRPLLTGEHRSMEKVRTQEKQASKGSVTHVLENADAMKRWGQRECTGKVQNKLCRWNRIWAFSQ